MKRDTTYPPDSIPDLKARLSEASRLWPDPEDAPDVPPAYLLDRFLTDRTTLPPDLVEQISSSVNCQRVLARTAGAYVGVEAQGSAEPPLPVEALNALLAEAGPPTKKTEPEHDFMQTVNRPGFAQIWSTCSKVEVWTGSGVGHRWTFLPPTVLLVSEPKEMPWDDTILRVVPLTPATLWPAEMMGDEEILLSPPGMEPHVAHLWLNYPLSTMQLGNFLRSLGEEDAENLTVAMVAHAEGLPLSPEEGAGLPIDPEEDREILLERERLHATAAWLSATADAQREYAEWAYEIQDNLHPLPSTFLNARPRSSIQSHDGRANLQPCAMSAAADDVSSLRCRVILWNGNLSALQPGASLQPGAEEKQPDLYARLTGGITFVDDVYAQWELLGDRSKLKAGGLFLLVEVDSGIVLGTGLLDETAGIATLKTGNWEKLEPYIHDTTGLALLIWSPMA